jgi:FG-GAP-like repeat
MIIRRVLCLFWVAGIGLAVAQPVLQDQRRTRYERVVTTVRGQAQWIEQGPAAIDSTQSYNQAGAIESILVDPSNPDRIFVGSVNGGIWRTDNGTDPNPNWRTATDHATSLSIGDLSFDPNDTSHNTIFAGVGNYSSYFGASSSVSGPLVGVLRSADGGRSWATVGSNTLNGLQVRNVLATVAMSPGQVVLVVTDQGLYRSTNGANTFKVLGTAEGLASSGGNVTNMVADPVSTSTFYAAIVGQGIYRSVDSGANWTNITGNIPTSGAAGVGTAVRIRLAISSAAPHPLYVAITADSSCVTDTCITAIYRKLNKQSTWTPIPIPGPTPEPLANFNFFAFNVDPQDPNTLYIAGNASYLLFEIGQANAAGVFSWSVQQGVVGTRDLGSPHMDCRQITFDSRGDLLLSSDGGLYRLKSPRDAAQRAWSGINGSLAITEMNSVAYDTLNAITFSGHQDTGSAQQDSEEATAWNDTTGGDGTEQGAANGDAASTVRFTSVGGNLSTLSRTVYSDKNVVISGPTAVNFASPSTPSQKYSGLLTRSGPNCPGGIPGPSTSFACLLGYGGFVLNKVEPSRMIFFGGALYEGALKGNGTGDYGDTIRVVPFPSNITSVIDNTHQAAAYGGWSNGIANPGVIYVGFQVKETGSTSLVSRLFTRADDKSSLVDMKFPDTNIASVAMSPSDWHVVYAVSSSHVYKFIPATGWTDVTGSLSLSVIRAVDIAGISESSADDRVVVGGDFGIAVSNNGGTGPWAPLGTNLPRVEVNDLHYYPAAARGSKTVGELLVAGTIGRGAWTWPFNAWRTSLSTETGISSHTWKGAWGSDGPIVTGDFNGDKKTDVMMWRDSTKSWTVNLSTGVGFTDHEWKGAWGSDGPIITGDFNGDGKTDVMMWRDSSKSWTVSLSTGSGFHAFEWKGAWGSDGPIVVGDFNGDGKTDVMMWRDSTKSWTVNLSTGSGFRAYEWKGAWGSDGPIVVGDFNGDGMTDVMMWRDSTKSWTVNISTGSGFDSFEWKGAWGSDGPIVTGDFNGDGKTDVMMWRDSTKSWTVNLSTGSGFSDFEWKGAWGSDGFIVTGDFNGDGKTDVMMWRDSTKSWTVNLSTGSGFSDFEWKGVWGSDGPTITGDFNGDKKTDLMIWRKGD